MSHPHKGIRYGGRAKGTPNKNTLPLADLAKKHGVDPFEILLLFAKGDSVALDLDEPIKAELRLKAAAEAVSYLHPKRKALEGGPTGTDPIRMSFEKFIGETMDDDE